MRRTANAVVKHATDHDLSIKVGQSKRGHNFDVVKGEVVYREKQKKIDEAAKNKALYLEQSQQQIAHSQQLANEYTEKLVKGCERRSFESTKPDFGQKTFIDVAAILGQDHPAANIPRYSGPDTSIDSAKPKEELWKPEIDDGELEDGEIADEPELDLVISSSDEDVLVIDESEVCPATPVYRPSSPPPQQTSRIVISSISTGRVLSDSSVFRPVDPDLPFSDNIY